MMGGSVQPEKTTQDCGLKEAGNLPHETSVLALLGGVSVSENDDL